MMKSFNFREVFYCRNSTGRSVGRREFAHGIETIAVNKVLSTSKSVASNELTCGASAASA